MAQAQMTVSHTHNAHVSTHAQLPTLLLGIHFLSFLSFFHSTRLVSTWTDSHLVLLSRSKSLTFADTVAFALLSGHTPALGDFPVDHCRMLVEDKHRPRQHSFSLNPLARAQTKSKDPSARLRTADSLIAASISLLLFGLVSLLITTDSTPSSDHQRPVFLQFPYSFIFFLPLLIPLSTYIVIARWTGEKHYRHS